MRAPHTVIVAGLASLVLIGVADTATAHRGDDAETVRMLDDCDPATFNAVLGAGACVGDGDTTFEEFMEELEEGGDNHWKNNPEETRVDAGEALHLVNRGGEFHTFTKVRSFSGGGCIRELNEPLGLPTRGPAFCGAAFSDPVLALPAGDKSHVPASRLKRGHNHFQCMIHPWMTTTVKVRAHH